MGIFDYVRLSDDLKRKLGKYGAEDYQTKYGLGGEYVSVYNAFDEYAPVWNVLTCVELFLKPRPGAVLTGPYMRTVMMSDIGEIMRAKVWSRLTSCLYSRRKISEKLESLGFEGPKDGEDSIYTKVSEELGRLPMSGAEISLSM